jgi:hypothetical protein
MTTIPRKAAATILNEMIASLQSRSNITNFSAGSLARTLLEVINTQFTRVYDVLDTTLLQGFVSSATGVYLDYLGQLLACARTLGESDEDYRYRISRTTLSMAQANETAVRLAVLGLPGVNDAKLQQYLYGNGSFGVTILTDELVPSTAVIETAQAVVDRVKGFGVYAKVLACSIGNVDLRYTLVGRADAAALAGPLKEAIQRHFDAVGAGGVLDLVYLARLPYTLAAGVTESRITDLVIDGNTVYSRESYTLVPTMRARVLNVRINA